MSQFPKIKKTTIDQEFTDGSRTVWTIDGHYTFGEDREYDEHIIGQTGLLTLSEPAKISFSNLEGPMVGVHTPPPLRERDFVQYRITFAPQPSLYKVLGPADLSGGPSVRLLSEGGKEWKEYERVLLRVEGVQVVETWKRPTGA